MTLAEPQKRSGRTARFGRTDDLDIRDPSFTKRKSRRIAAGGAAAINRVLPAPTHRQRSG